MSGWACGCARCGSRGRSGGPPPRTSATSSRPGSRAPRTTPSPTTCEGRSVTDVAVIGFAEAPSVRRTDGTTNGVEMLVPIFGQVLEQTGLSRRDIGFWCSGSSDYLAGRAFSFVSAVDAIGAFPPVMESHVEMDGAWALYEAWVKVSTGDVDVALAYG